jgi:hypothetical protein
MMKKHYFSVVSLLFAAMLSFTGCEEPGENANEPEINASHLKVHYLFNPHNANVKIIHDETDNGYNGTLGGDADIQTEGELNVLNIKSTGYADLGASFGGLVKTLASFTVACFIKIDPATDLNQNGNFIFSFANSNDIMTDRNGNMFLSAKLQRYAISLQRYEDETGIQTGSPLEKGLWKHVMYVQSKNIGTLLIDGVPVETGTVSLQPKQLGQTRYNYIGKSCYSGDVLLKNTRVADFRIYDSALTDVETAKLNITGTLEQLNSSIVTPEINAYIAELEASLTALKNVTANIILPQLGGGNIAVSWSSDKPQYLSGSGIVTRPAYGAADQTVVLTGSFTKGGITVKHDFTFVVKADEYSDAESVERDKADLSPLIIPNYYRRDNNRIAELPASGANGSTITWTTNKPAAYTVSGGKLVLPADSAAETGLELTAVIKKNSASVAKIFTDFSAAAESQAYAGYLFVYFKGNGTAEQQICYALSEDALHWNALNNNNAVFYMPKSPTTVTGAVRDPFILRGDDGCFYMTCTDMDASNGWDSNYAIILSKSRDLINWTHSSVNIKAKYPQFSGIRAAWAPQVFWDNTVNKYMVYFSTATAIGDSANDKIYYTYANSDFTELENTVQQLLFVGEGDNENNYSAAIDGDIVYRNGTYYLFYKTEGWRNGTNYDHSIVKAASPSLTGPYYGYNDANKAKAVLLDKLNSAETRNNVEGSSTFRITGTDDWFLIYDVYNQNDRYDFAKSADGMASFTDITSQITRDFNPRHGAVIPLTATEMTALRNMSWSAQ